MNLSIYKIVLQDIPEIIGVVLITSNTIYFWFKKLSLKKHNKVGVIENEDFDNEEIEDGTVENDNAMEERDDDMDTKDNQPLPVPEILCLGENLSQSDAAVDKETNNPSDEERDSPDTAMKQEENEIELMSIESRESEQSSNTEEKSRVRKERSVEEDSINVTLETTMNNNYMLLLVLYGTLASSLTRSVSK